MLIAAMTSLPLMAQTAPTSTAGTAANTNEDEAIMLSPFEVTADESVGYMATTSLAGTRINTNLADVGSAISVVTAEFLRDTGAVDNRTLLQYTTNTEVASLQGNFTKASSGNQMEEGTFTTPNANTRVRGLTSADNTRNFFLTDIPWDGYNVDRVDMQRGPNAILFGMGSPAGIINTSTKAAQFRNFGELEMRYGSYDANRVTLDINRELLDNELAVRINLLRNDDRFRQRPSYSLDRRGSGTLRYEPKFLNNEDHTTTIKANYEKGVVRSNNPRVITPIDFITPWFNSMNKGTYNPLTVNDNDARYIYDDTDTVTGYYYVPNTGQSSSVRGAPPVVPPAETADGAPANEFYQPWLGGFASSYEGSPLTFFSAGSSAPNLMEASSFANLINGRNSSGGIDKGIDAFPSNTGRVLVNGDYNAVAGRLNLPFANFGLYKNPTLTDPSIFDFYNNLLDGDNKKEWQKFDNFSVSLSQTFFKRKFGYEFAYDQSSYTRGQYSLMTDWRAGILIDINTHDIDGSPNPNLGKPFIADAGIYGNNEVKIDRRAYRLNAFFDQNFNKEGKGGWVRRLVGRHTLSGMLSGDMYREDNRSFMRWGTDEAYSALVSTTPISIRNNRRVVHPVVYLSDTSLLNVNLADGLHIPRASAEVVMPNQMKYTYFDSTWNAPSSVGFGDRYINPRTNQIQTQSENPDNYVGFRTTDINILDADNPVDRDALTYGASLQRKDSTSAAAVWQAYLWDGGIVGMYAIRQDRIKSWSRAGIKDEHTEHVDFNAIDPDTGLLAYDTAGWEPSITTKNSPSWSVVAHLHRLLGPRIYRLPVNISLFYNESQNFQIQGTRYNIYGEPIALPSGTTKDRGILISTKDNRFSLRVNKYESNVLDAPSTSGLNTWYVGNNGDTLFTRGENRADMFEYHLGTLGDPSSADDPSTSWNYDYQPRAGQTQAQANAQRDAAVAGWRALTATPQIQRFLKAFGYSDFGVTQPTTLKTLAGFAMTEDQVSRGYEIEFTANPTKNWRLTFNASKAEATRSNVGGADFAEFVDIVNTALNGPAGDIRLWWGGDTNTLLTDWNSTFYSNYSLMRLQEGTFSPELRKWRFNLITNYNFESGFLKGAWAGIGYRWQDRVAIGYKPLPTDDPSIITFDLANPYYGPKEDAVDFWIGYSRKLTDRVGWRIQLNVRNAFQGDKLIPLTTQPDGSVAAWRIAPSQTWQLTNTFTF
jgi:hypothetical protein